MNMKYVDLETLMPLLNPFRYIRKSSDEKSGKQAASEEKQFETTDEIIDEHFPDKKIPTFKESITAKQPYEKPRPKWRNNIIQAILDGLCNCIICWKLSSF